MRSAPAVRRAMARVLVLLLGVTGVTPVAAQGVRGVLVGALTARPVSGGLVGLLDSTGREAARTVTDEAGRFYLRAPAPGSYRLRALRIGYRSWQSRLVALAAGAVIEYRIEMPEVPIQLDAVTVEAESRCRVRPENGEGTATLWEEARKALTVTALTLERKVYRFRTVSVDRTLDATLRPEAESRRVSVGLSDWPFQSLPAESLARAGFVQDAPGGPIYYGPDIDVLFSDSFLAGHCFWIERMTPADSNAIGLAFAPTPGRRVREIAGTLWLDRHSAELRYLEFRYTNLGAWVPPDRAGGRLEFQRLPTGAWIVRRWWLRAPVPRLTGGGGAPVLHGFQEQGGEVADVFMADGHPVPLPPDSGR